MSEVYMKFVISLCYSLSYLQKGTSDTDQRENTLFLFSETYDTVTAFI